MLSVIYYAARIVNRETIPALVSSLFLQAHFPKEPTDELLTRVTASLEYKITSSSYFVDYFSKTVTRIISLNQKV